jgi:sugar/nucleoside kinase (ribokinase family)
MHDVYAYGVIAPSTLIELSDEFPAASGYAEIAGVYPSIGGEAAGGAYVLARLGVATKLAGNRLGTDDDSTRVVDVLGTAGVDCSAIRRDAAAPVHEVVFAAGEDRTVFGTYGRLLADRAWDQPSQTDVATSRIVCLDPFFSGGSDLAAQWCVDDGIPYVTVDTPPDSKIARQAAVVIISKEFAARTFDAFDPYEALAVYTDRCRGLVILTGGSAPVLYGRHSEEPGVFAPFPVEVRDTTGAGDSFRAGIIYGMLRGYDDRALVRTAGAMAAIVCQRIPGVLDSPTEDELEGFLAVR